MITLEDAIKMLEARLDCMHRSSSGIDVDCNREKCDDCDSNYAQGTVGEQQEALKEAISALEKQIPKKPTETIDRAWGISCRQAVCPECDCFLGQVHFLGDGKQKIAYCERCGQAVDFSEWKEGE